MRTPIQGRPGRPRGDPMEDDKLSQEKLLIEAGKEALSAAINWYGRRRARVRTEGRVEAVQSEALPSWVVSYYEKRGSGRDLFEIGSGRGVYRVAFLTRPEWQGLGKVRLNLNASWHSQVEVTELVKLRREQGCQVVDRPLYCLCALVPETDGVSLRVGVCRYEQFVSCCGLLEDETIGAARKPSKWKTAKTVLRDTAAPNLEVLATCPLGAHGIGVAATIVAESEDGRVVLLQERGQGTITHGGLTAVVPMFAFQPMVGDVAREFNLTHQFLREYGEELLGMPELQTSDSHVAFDWFYEREEIAEVARLMATGEISIEITGFGFDAVNGEPNLALLVHIGAREYWKRIRRSLLRSWEAKRVFDAPLDATYEAFRAKPLGWSPGSAFAFEMGVRALAAGA